MKGKKTGGRRRKEDDRFTNIVFRGAAVDLLNYQGKEALLAGAAGTGKSVGCLFKLHICCEYVPGIRCLMVRKTRASLTESGLVTWEQMVLPPNHWTLRKGGKRMLRQSYVYPNKSEVIVGGLDKANKILSTEFDLIYVQEATELQEDDWETLATRLRNNVLSYQQILADCNPGAPSHWLKRRCDSGKCMLFNSRHQDNPAYYDIEKDDWTELGRNYLKTLSDSLTGTRRERFLEGKWAQAEGAVYPEFDERIHILDPRKMPWGGLYPPPDWPRYWGIDFGYTNPFVCLMMAQDHDGRMYFYREIYKTGTLVEDHAKRMLELWREEADHWGIRRKVPTDIVMKQIAPRAIICDHDAEDRATLERHLGLSTTGARKYVRKGIQMVSERLRIAGDGKPRMFFVHGMLDKEDRALTEGKLPTSTIQEFHNYVWNPEKDAPVKEFDHGADVVRYLTIQLDTGMTGLWEPATMVVPDNYRRGDNPAVEPSPALRWGEDMGDRIDKDRRGYRLFGRDES